MLKLLSLPMFASLLLACMALSSVLHLFVPVLPLWVSGLCGWLALVLLLLPSPTLRPFTQFFALSIAGLCLLLGAGLRGAPLHFTDILLQNNGLLVMLYCVGFLRLIASEQAKPETLPRGKSAFLQTLMGVHVLGAVINMSVLVLMAERLHAQQALGKQATIVLNRGFSMAAFWSPFFAAMAVALTYAPGAQLHPVVLTGLGLMAIAMLISVVEIGGLRLQQVAEFRGYPLHFASLIIPALLAVTVLVLHVILPTVPVLSVVSVTSVVLSMAYLCVTDLPTAKARLVTHMTGSGSRMVREMSLFLGAGLLSVGVQSLFSTLTWQPFQTFGGWQAGLTLAVVLLVSLLGVHPVVSIAVLGSLLAPLHVDPNLLAVFFLCIWSIGVVASPFSGVNTVLRSQFEISGMDLVKGNALYVVLMWGIIALWFAWQLG